MQSGTVIAVIRIIRADTAQRWFAAIPSVGQLALVFDAGEPGLDIIEFRSSNQIFVTRRQDLCDLFLRVSNTVRSLRMIGEGSRHSPRLVFLQVLNLFKEGNEGLGVVAGAVHVFDAKVVGLGFELTGEFEEGQRDGKVRSLIYAVS